MLGTFPQPQTSSKALRLVFSLSTGDLVFSRARPIMNAPLLNGVSATSAPVRVGIAAPLHTGPLDAHCAYDLLSCSAHCVGGNCSAPVYDAPIPKRPLFCRLRSVRHFRESDYVAITAVLL